MTLPPEVLDDRLAIVGTAGSGKTYLATSVIETLLSRKHRVIAIDPLGVMWGLRLMADGTTPSPYKPVIFGGAHGDLPISEHAGGLIGEAVARAPESCIIDLSELGKKASERRFMLGFLTALYRETNKEPVHLIIDEADMFAPQRLLDKEGDAAKLLGMMETVVRRGRVRGFIPWLITQRPAVVSKDVLSQADGLVALKLTSSQDRDAIGDWVQGQADKKEWAQIWGDMPTLPRGRGLIWIPARGIMRTETFPPKTTFDSSRTPKRGEKPEAVELRPLDVGTLRDRLGKVEAEVKAGDPKALRAEVARLTRELAAKPAADPAADEHARESYNAGWNACAKVANDRYGDIVITLIDKSNEFSRTLSEIINTPLNLPVVSVEGALTFERAGLRVGDTWNPLPELAPAGPPTHRVTKVTRDTLTVEPLAPKPNGHASDLTGPQRQLLAALAWWRAAGKDEPSRAQVAAIAGWRVTSGHLKNVAGSCRSAGLIDYPSDGRLQLTEAGAAVAEMPDGPHALTERVRSVLSGPQTLVFDALLSAGKALDRDSLARRVGWEPTSGHVKNVLGSLRSLELITYPAAGVVELEDWVQ